MAKQTNFQKETGFRSPKSFSNFISKKGNSKEGNQIDSKLIIVMKNPKSMSLAEMHQSSLVGLEIKNGYCVGR